MVHFIEEYLIVPINFYLSIFPREIKFVFSVYKVWLIWWYDVHFRLHRFEFLSMDIIALYKSDKLLFLDFFSGQVCCWLLSSTYFLYIYVYKIISWSFNLSTSQSCTHNWLNVIFICVCWLLDKFIGLKIIFISDTSNQYHISYLHSK